MTTEPYLPDWTDLRDRYAFHASVHTGATVEEARRDAERGIEAIKTKARAEAWDDGYAKGALDDLLDRNQPTPNPYREQEEA